MSPALRELLAFPKVSANAKLVALHVADVAGTEVGTLRTRDVADALSMPRNDVERATRELMKLGWLKSPRPDEVSMPADALARRAIGWRRPAAAVDGADDTKTTTTRTKR